MESHKCRWMDKPVRLDVLVVVLILAQVSHKMKSLTVAPQQTETDTPLSRAVILNTIRTAFWQRTDEVFSVPTDICCSLNPDSYWGNRYCSFTVSTPLNNTIHYSCNDKPIVVWLCPMLIAMHYLDPIWWGRLVLQLAGSAIALNVISSLCRPPFSTHNAM